MNQKVTIQHRDGSRSYLIVDGNDDMYQQIRLSLLRCPDDPDFDVEMWGNSILMVARPLYIAVEEYPILSIEDTDEDVCPDWIKLPR